MTRNEAIDLLDNLIGMVEDNHCSDYDTALRMGIKALQEPCEDAISRDFQIGDEVRIIGSDPIYDDCDVGWVIRNASERVKTMYVMRNDGSAEEENKEEWYKTGRHNYMLAEVINALPSIKQEPKTGHWIMRHRKVNTINYRTGEDVLTGEIHTVKELIRYECDEPYCAYCGKRAEDISQDYCGYCGARMEGKQNG